MTTKGYTLRNVEESRGDEHDEGVPDREDREGLRPGQILTVLFLGESGAAPVPVVLMENRNDAYVAHLLDPDDAAAHCPGGLVAFGPEHVAHLFDGDLPIGTQQISHYETEIVLGVDDVAPEDLRRLNHFPYLYRLTLTGMPVADLAFLREITSLETLDIDETSVSDLTPVRGLVALNTLFASRTNVQDLEPLSSIHALEGLRLSYTPVYDLTPIRDLRGLKYLNIGVTKVTTMPALAGLQSLEILDISGTEISDWSWLSECSSLVKLNALSTYFDSLLPLAAATNLKRVTLSVWPSADLSVLTTLKKLVSVGVLLDEEDGISPAQQATLDVLASRGVDVVQSDDVDELVDLLSPVIN